MSKPWIHSISSARKFGGKPEDYFEIHDFMDSSKGACADNRHRILTHQNFFLSNILERVKFQNSGPEINCKFPTIINSDGKAVSVRDVGEQHCIEDMNCIPTVGDYMEHMDIAPWMMNKGKPNSFKRLREKKVNQQLDPSQITFDGTLSKKELRELPLDERHVILEQQASGLEEYYNKISAEELKD